MTTRLGLYVATLALGGALAGCAGEKPASTAATTTTAGSTGAPATGGAEVLATVGGEPIKLDDIRDRVGPRLDQLEAQYQKAKVKILEGALDEELRERVMDAEAQKTGKTIDQLMQAEVGGSYEPTDAEIAQWYEENKARMGGRALADVRLQVADRLRAEKQRTAGDKLRSRLYAEKDVKVLLEPYRVPIEVGNAPSFGKQDAKVTLVEYSDFQCPFCARFAPTLKMVKDNYGDRVRVVYKQFPIPGLHPNAIKAAEASLCAHEQGKFWEMHDIMFSEQDRLGPSELKDKAGRIGLDRKKFEQCLDGGKYAQQVQTEMAEAPKAGATGTPAVYVNGAEVPGGAVGYEVVAAALDRELARVK